MTWLTRTLALSVLLVALAGCSSSRRGTGPGVLPPGRDAGTVPGGGAVDDALAAIGALADQVCPCQVMSGEYASIEECRADVIDSDQVTCARELYPSQRSAGLDAALACQADGIRAVSACVASMGCDAIFSCLEASGECPPSSELDAFDNAVEACADGSPPPPPPGTCTPRSSGTGTGTAVFSGTTAGPSALSGSCGGDSAPEAVHPWTAPASGTYTIDTFGSEYDTLLYVLVGSCSGTELGCNDDAMDLQSQVTVTATAGQILYIVVDGFSSNEGAYVVNIATGTPTS